MSDKVVKKIEVDVLAVSLVTKPLHERGPGYPVSIHVKQDNTYMWYDLATAQVYFRGVEQHPSGLFDLLTRHEEEKITAWLSFDKDNNIIFAAFTYDKNPYDR